MVQFITNVTAYLQTLFTPLGLLAAVICVLTLILGLVLKSSGLMVWAKWAFFAAIIGLGGSQILGWVSETARAMAGGAAG